METTSLRPLFDAGRLWKGNATLTLPVTETGLALLNTVLTGGGWPAHMLIEWLTDQPESLPIQCALSTWRYHQDDRWLVLVNPPHRPCAEALLQQGLNIQRVDCIQAADAESAWCLEQLAQSACIASIVAWRTTSYHNTQLRRLQLACQQGQTQLFLVRDSATRTQASPAPVRVQLHQDQDRFAVEVFKQPGASARPPVWISHALEWIHATPPAQRKSATIKALSDVH